MSTERSHFSGKVTRYYDNGTDWVLTESLKDNEHVGDYISISRRAAIKRLSESALGDDFKLIARALKTYAEALEAKAARIERFSIPHDYEGSPEDIRDEAKRVRFVLTWATA